MLISILSVAESVYFGHYAANYTLYTLPARKSLARLTFGLQWAPTEFDPVSLDYWQGIGTLSLLGIIIVIVAFLFSNLWIYVRKAGCCGGLEPRTDGYFDRKERRRNRPYPFYLVYGLFAVSLVLSLMIAYVLELPHCLVL